MLRISEASNLAVHALAYLAQAQEDDRRHASVTEISRLLGCSPSHLAKVLSGLAHQEFVSSSRGAAGGYRLLRDPGTVSVLDVIEAVEGPLPRPACLLGRPVCEPGSCIFRGLHSELQERVTNYLQGITLKDFRIRAISAPRSSRSKRT